MKPYEMILIYDPLLTDEALEAEIKKTEETIQKFGGKVLGVDKWGRRKLAYLIKKKREGVFAVFNFQGNSKMVSELDRTLKIYEPILRHMMVRQELPLPQAKEETKIAPKEESKTVAKGEAPQEAT